MFRQNSLDPLEHFCGWKHLRLWSMTFSLPLLFCSLDRFPMPFLGEVEKVGLTWTEIP